jgi:anaerobic magnesium-protoporphyrin IX monomethyl ester cyclase
VVVAGEAEYLMRNLMMGLVRSEPLMDAGIVRDLDVLPYPARHLFPKSNVVDYSGIHGQEKNTPATTIIRSRGCPYACKFCSKGHQMLSQYRYRSPANVVGELRQIMNNYGVEHVRFVDDEFTLNMGNTMSLMKAMGDLELTFICITRVDALNRELIREMKLSGCREIHVGVETGSDRLLQLMNKQTTSKDLLEGVKMIKEERVRVKTYLMMRFPGETEKDREATIRWVSEAKPDKLTLSVFTPLPGSEIAKDNLEGSHAWYYRDNDEAFLQYRARLLEAAGID